MHDERHHADHDYGLAHDLAVMNALASRRRALRWFGGVGTVAVLSACGGADGSESGTVVTPTPTPSATPTTSATATPTPTPTASAGATCVADASETNGPYPADGTNTSRGSTSNVLTATNVVRSDIRSSFIGTSTTVAPGVAVTLTLTIVNVNAACAPLAGYAIYVWHCDRAGQYSLYDVPAESWLRGVGVTDSNGQVTFTTIFPGCYSGRYPHIHFELFSSLALATGGRYARLIGQLAMPAAQCSSVYAGATGYSSSATNFARVSISGDNVFGDNSAAQIAQQTLTMTGAIDTGFVATGRIGLAL